MHNNIFDADEIDALQELMNIAFGQAAAELAEIIDITVELSFPKLDTVPVRQLPEVISANTSGMSRFNIVEQAYKGPSSGVAYLIFPVGTEKDFVCLFHSEGCCDDDDFVVDIEREVLAEVGNILIGACVSKIFELLKTPVTYTPPHTSVGMMFKDALFCSRFKQNDFAIMLETSFSLSEKSINGYLFLINEEKSATPLKKALNDFFESYE